MSEVRASMPKIMNNLESGQGMHPSSITHNGKKNGEDFEVTQDRSNIT